jgi:hypothetical protein
VAGDQAEARGQVRLGGHGSIERGGDGGAVDRTVLARRPGGLRDG